MKTYPININTAPNPLTRVTLYALAQAIYIPYLAELQKFSPAKAI